MSYKNVNILLGNVINASFVVLTTDPNIFEQVQLLPYIKLNSDKNFFKYQKKDNIA